jgi:hypothetical protein
MKKWIVIGVVIIFLLLGITVVFLLLRPASAPASPLNTNPFADALDTGTANLTESPDTFSTDFYKWYIANKEKDSGFPSTNQLTTEFTQWATPQFILQYQSAKDDPDLDADPILFAQDDPRGWGPGMTGTIVSQTDTTSTVTVVIGTGSIHTYTLQLNKDNGHWLINSISGSY